MKKKIVIAISVTLLFTASLFILNNQSKYESNSKTHMNANYNSNQEITANNLSYNNSKTNLNCDTVQCVIDEISKKLNK